MTRLSFFYIVKKYEQQNYGLKKKAKIFKLTSKKKIYIYD